MLLGCDQLIINTKYFFEIPSIIFLENTEQYVMTVCYIYVLLGAVVCAAVQLSSWLLVTASLLYCCVLCMCVCLCAGGVFCLFLFNF